MSMSNLDEHSWEGRVRVLDLEDGGGGTPVSHPPESDEVGSTSVGSPMMSEASPNFLCIPVVREADVRGAVERAATRTKRIRKILLLRIAPLKLITNTNKRLSGCSKYFRKKVYKENGTE